MRFKQFLKSVLPPIMLSYILKSKSGFEKHESTNSLFHCPLCNSNFYYFRRLDNYLFEMFDEFEFVHSIFLFETLNILNYYCPVCESSDRNRIYALFLKQNFDLFRNSDQTIKILDIAPDTKLRKWIKRTKNINYRSVDLFMVDTDDTADITNLKIYDTASYDIIICSHVLEHVPDDRKAMSEIYRILKPKGFAIIMVPILLSLNEDLENPLWTSEAERWKYYGQKDHVRMYSKKGFIEKLEQTGFKVNQLDKEYFGPEVFKKNGIHQRSVLYVSEK